MSIVREFYKKQTQSGLTILKNGRDWAAAQQSIFAYATPYAQLARL
jgi:hypothetical protein